MKIQKELLPIGQIHFGNVSEASVAYTLKYMCKPAKIKKNDKTGRVREFSLMSKGLGSRYLRTQMVDWHKAKETSRVYVAIDGNKKVSMPRYYKDKIYNSESKAKIAKQRSADLSAQAKRVTDVQKFQHNFNQGKIAAYKKMNSNDNTKTTL